MDNTLLTAAPLAGSLLGLPTGDFVVAEWEDPGGSPDPPRYIAPLHLHHHDDEAWYVLEGSLCVLSGDSVILANAGCGVFVPKGTPHTYWNPLKERTRYLLIMTANIHQLISAIHATTERTPDKMKELFGRYDSELLG
jgi:mannose-6-phosphate isomerase-like protein (cupin superfamily)